MIEWTVVAARSTRQGNPQTRIVDTAANARRALKSVNACNGGRRFLLLRQRMTQLAEMCGPGIQHIGEEFKIVADAMRDWTGR
jgi:hypothetical protein